VRDVQRVYDGGRGGDVSADQQRARGLDGDLGQDRQAVAPGLAACAFGGIDRGLDLQGILAGLDQQSVDAAVDQPGALNREGGLERVVVDVAERRQPGPRADRAEHETVPAVAGEGLERLADQFRRALVDLESPLLETELRQGERRTAEAVGLDDVRAGREIALVDVEHDVGTRQIEHLGAVLALPEIRLHIQVEGLDTAAHGAVAEQHPFGESFEQRAHVRPGPWPRTLAAVRGRRRCPVPGF
jgi:hypothetical protein